MSNQLQEAVKRHLQYGYWVLGNTVRLSCQDNVTYLENKLKKDGLSGFTVCYFDGTRTFTADELKSVMVIGACDHHPAISTALDNLYGSQTFTKLIYLDTRPSRLRALDESAIKWAHGKKIAVKPIDVDWKLGKNAPAIRYGKLVGKRSRTKPDVVVAFTNHEATTPVKQAQKAGIEVVFA